MKEKELIKSQFEDFKTRIRETYNYALFEERHESIHYFLYEEMERVNKEIQNEIEQLTFEPTLISGEIAEWIKFLEKDIELKKKSMTPIRRKIGTYLTFFYESLAEIQNRLPEPPTDKAVEKVRRKVTVSDYNRTVLKQKQVLLLMHYFKKHKLITSDIQDKTLAELFEGLTGFGGEQLRKDYSGFKKGDIEYKNEDLDQLKDILVKIGEDIVKNHGKEK